MSPRIATRRPPCNPASVASPAASEVERLFADSGLMRSLTGWTPAYGGGDGFRRGLSETIAWFSDPANLARYKTDRYVL